LYLVLADSRHEAALLGKFLKDIYGVVQIRLAFRIQASPSPAARCEGFP
jgi:hypothetical protein